MYLPGDQRSYTRPRILCHFIRQKTISYSEREAETESLRPSAHQCHRKSCELVEWKSSILLAFLGVK